ncbi:btb poz domain-containing protein [Apiospora arundinis]|uniref:Btb poz domain-containing protein n=1 Tax=Apiospora arundinis TaxID=335852 RepID=A0ABR2JJL6_9PEZI
MASSSQHVGELLRSLKKLFDSGVYTDLNIVCGNDQHQVHKAIVCLRSGRLAQMCSEIGPNQEATITIPDDDPQTIDLMLQYLYTLEYQPRLVTSTAALTTKPLTNGINGHHHKDNATPSPKTAVTTNGGAPLTTGGAPLTTGTTNGNQPQQLPLQQKPPQQPAAPPATTLEYSIERETFEAVPAAEAAAKLSKKAAKKKKRGSTDTAAALVAPEQPPTAPATTSSSTAATAATATTTTTANAAAQTVPPAAIPNESAAAAAAPQKPPQHALLQHARLYTLAHKYAVPGLRALSAQRFADEAEQYWASDDFLAAAVEAYNNPAPKPTSAVTTAIPKQATAPATNTKNGMEKEDEVVVVEAGEEGIKPKQSIRDVVLSNMKAHPELLDRAAVQEAIRVNAELSFDLMMYFRETQNAGGSASSVVSY